MSQPNEMQLDVLEHYGILGMKWGRRRDQRTLDLLAGRRRPGDPSGAGKPKEENKSSDDNGGGSSSSQGSDGSSSKSDRKKDLSNRRSLSTSELKSKIERLKLESELRKLTNEDLKPLQTRVEKLLADAGMDVSKRVVSAAMAVAVQKLLANEAVKPADFLALVAAAMGNKKK